ncbi:MAG: Rrf2 family transcriptional regulator [Oscillospiraceae bacterium]|nr:Rrf2 family transcriptional regulator [Oscillospiraceae bacterium]
MRISSKGRYAIAALIEMALDGSGDYITVATLAGRLNVSKVYLEQIFSLLKRGGVVLSGKGSQGGYLLSDKPEHITLYKILSPIELSLSERTKNATEGLSFEIAATVSKLVFQPLDEALIHTLTSITLADLTAEVQQRCDGGSMYYI